jgi:hypothetical protein
MATATVILNCARMSPSIASIDHIAHLRVGLGRGGYELRLANVSAELGGLILLAGLAETLRVEVQGQTEQRKQPRRVEEERDLPDHPI